MTFDPKKTKRPKPPPRHIEPSSGKFSVTGKSLREAHLGPFHPDPHTTAAPSKVIAPLLNIPLIQRVEKLEKEIADLTMKIDTILRSLGLDPNSLFPSQTEVSSPAQPKQ